MKIENIYKSLVVIISLIFVSLWFGAYAYKFLGDDTRAILSYLGYGAVISFGGISGWIWFFAFMISTLGMLLFKKMLRLFFVFMILMNMVLLPFLGVMVATGFEIMLSDISSVLSGVVLCLAYLPPLNAKFK